MKEPMKKKIFTGIKPTSDQIHLGNYFGAVKPLFDIFKEEDDAEVFFMVASMHALTTIHDGEELAENSLNLVKLYIAMMRNAGIDDDALRIFNSPQVPAHAELTWVLQCITHMGFMERMHAYKDAVAKGKAGEISVGTFCYPIMMAIDVLAYDSTHVPVGQDQKQHVEYIRDIAESFNKKFGETFVLPKALIKEDVATVPGTDGRKMSKSYNNYIGLLEDEKTIRKKVARIPTAAIGIEEPKDPDKDNVYAIWKLFLSAEEDKLVRKEYTEGGLSYKDAKERLADKIWEFIEPIQKHFEQVDEQDLAKILNKNAAYCNTITQKKVEEVYKKVGFILDK